MSTPNAPSPQIQSPRDAFGVSKTSSGAVTMMSMRGTIDHGFDGKKLAGSISTNKVILNLRQVRRFASWGMSEWMDFLRQNLGRDLYLVECSTYAVSQLNLVTGLLGHAKLLSFYASYRCMTCKKELETQFLIPRDRERIPFLPTSEQECPKCNGSARLEEYPAAFFDTIAARPPVDIDDEILGYLRSELNYDIQPDQTRFRAHRRVKDAYTYIRLSGSVANLPAEQLVAASEGTTVVDLERALFDPEHMEAWGAYIEGAMQKVASLQLLQCPPGFLEQGVAVTDLHDKVKVRSFACVYQCPRCMTMTAQMVDVADNLEQLAMGVAPPAACGGCESLLVPTIPPALSALMRALPARDRDPALDKLLDKARGEPIDKLENVLLLDPKKPKAAAGPSRAMYIAIGLTMVVLLGLGGVAFVLYKDRGGKTTTVVGGTNPITNPAAPPKPAFERPEWVISDVPSSGYCLDQINRLMCVGVSAYRATREEGVSDANEAALDELVNAVGLKISDAFFRDNIMSEFTDTRNQALSALQAVDLDRASPAFTKADEAVTKARKRVVDVLQVSGGAAVPAQRTDWYWEEYKAKNGGSEFLVYIRYDVTLDAVKVLTEKYSASTKVGDSMMMTAFPALAWQLPEFTGGALVLRPGRAFSEAGVAKFDVIQSAATQRVGDIAALNRRLDEWKPAAGPLELQVLTGDKPPHPATLKSKK